jgi:hypothetical protein
MQCIWCSLFLACLSLYAARINEPFKGHEVVGMPDLILVDSVPGYIRLY